jgi:integrase/recombinase XerD
MLAELLPKTYENHRSLPLLGGTLEAFDDWLIAHGYQLNTRQSYVLRCTAIEKYFRRRGVHQLASLTPEKLQQCHRFFRHRAGGISHTAGCLQRFLQSGQFIPPPVSAPSKPFDATLDAYLRYLIAVRGLAPTTVDLHHVTVRDFLEYLLKQDRAFRLTELRADHVEGFIRRVAKRFGRGTLQHAVAHVRGFLRFLSVHGNGPVHQNIPIDTPRLYRPEQLPRSLPWRTVQAFLKSIDRRQSSGLRDYAMFLLIATYGLRGCDIAGLLLSDIDWRAGVLHVRQRKTARPLSLPLNDAVANALVCYLREARPHCTHREVFLTAIAPIAPLKRQAVGYAFRYRVRSGVVDIPFEGVHCLRHSYATHLLRSGIALKTIGDLLGHSDAESTCVYLRMKFDDLREVALSLPPEACRESQS